MSELPSQPSLPAIAEDLFCQKCGYNLRGLTGEICPECGSSLAGVRANVSQIPWVHRKDLGWWRAYWKTVFFVMFRQRHFAEEMARPVSYRDSQSFRWLTVVLVAIPSSWPIIAMWLTWEQPFGQGSLGQLIRPSWALPLLYCLWLIYIAAASGVPSYFFHPRGVSISQQNRAIALSYYAGGVLALLAFPLASLAIAIATAQANDPVISLAFGILVITLPIAAVAPWWLDLVHLARRLLPQKTGRAVIVAIVVPASWCLLAIAIAAATIVCVLSAAVIWDMLL